MSRHSLCGLHVSQLLYYLDYNLIRIFLVLDPRISYSKLKDDAGGDIELLSLIESARTKLKKSFVATFAHMTPAPLDYNNVIVTQSTASSIVSDDILSSPSKSSTFAFMSSYESNNDESDPLDELTNYFNMKREKSWKDTDIIQWWSARRAQFPHLSKFACSIYCIPGKLI